MKPPFSFLRAAGPSALLVTCLAAPSCTRSPPEEALRAPVKYYTPPQRKFAGNASATSETPAAGCSNAPGQIFPPDAPWNRSIASTARAADSDAIVQFLEHHHGDRAKFQVDFSLVTLEASASTPRKSFTPTSDHYSPDCDRLPLPIVPGGLLEGENGYACKGDGDCHLLVLERQECRLYEMWRADLRGSGLEGGCLAVWNIAEPYPEHGRGEDCTSADAAGLPIAPLLFGPEDIARGEIGHALRFVLPNSLIRELTYVRPATHATKATRGPSEAPPYGALLRLRADVDLQPFKPAARVVLTALQTYGMYLADGGRVTFTARSDALSELKWSDIGFGAQDLKALEWTDFEVVDMGERRKWRGECSRTPLVE